MLVYANNLGLSVAKDFTETNVTDLNPANGAGIAHEFHGATNRITVVDNVHVIMGLAAPVVGAALLKNNAKLVTPLACYKLNRNDYPILKELRVASSYVCICTIMF